MKTVPVGEFEAHFSAIIEPVRSDEEIIIAYGEKKESIAALIPHAADKRQKIRLGILRSKRFKIRDDFEMTEEKLLDL